MGVLNLYVAYNFSTSVWATFKVFGVTGLMLAFMVAPGLLHLAPPEATRAGWRRRPAPCRSPASGADSRVSVSAAEIEAALRAGAGPRALAVATTATSMPATPARAKGATSASAIASARFQGLGRIARHRLVYDALHAPDAARHPRPGHRCPRPGRSADRARAAARCQALHPLRSSTSSCRKARSTMKKTLSRRAHRCSPLAASLPLAAQAQNIAIVNGKPVPKARVDALITQVSKQAAARGQQLPPDIEKLVARQGRADEILARKPSGAASPARPNTRRRWSWRARASWSACSPQDIDKKNPVSDADIQAEYDKFKAQAQRHRVQGAPHPGREGRRSEGDVAQLKAGAKFEDLAKKNSKDPARRQNGGDLDFASAGVVRSGVLAGDGRAEEGRVHRDAGEDAVRLSHHQARGHARRSVPAARRRQGADPATPGAAEGAGVPRRAARQGEDRLQVQQLRRAAGEPGATSARPRRRPRPGPASMRSWRSQRAGERRGRG